MMPGLPSSAAEASASRTVTGAITRCWNICGTVQGVGFRPWLCRIATELGLSGEVSNDPSGVWLWACGPEESVNFLEQACWRPPFPARVTQVTPVSSHLLPWSVTPGLPGFRIISSHTSGSGGPALTPDLAPCPACLEELKNPHARRHAYPFLACTACGPRYTVCRSMPYDRVRTSMAGFPLCPKCRKEYESPADRHFHAQAMCCPDCGPRLRFLSPTGLELAADDDAIQQTVAALMTGKIVAIQGVGGFQLWVDASNDDAVKTLRHRKHRDAKPLAVMVENLDAARCLAVLGPEEEALLTGPSAPIVIAQARPTAGLSAYLAPGNHTLGLCLPASPLQWLLCTRFARPVVATSGNLSGEPLCYEPSEALRRLGSVADQFLVHNREIVQPADDSVLRVMAARPRLIRRARGYAPSPLEISKSLPAPGIAMGGQIKGTLALARDHLIVASPHLGDLDTVAARTLHQCTAATMQHHLHLTPAWVACDSHPDYAASVMARNMPLPRLEVQHHHAHVLAVLAEQTAPPDHPVLGIIWDGSGFGPDGTIWGGEFFVMHGSSCRRVANFRAFPLPGGNAAIREPRRSAFGWLWETLGPEIAENSAPHPHAPAGLMHRLCAGAANTLRTSSVGRYFDAVASLTGILHVSEFEGQAAMGLESAAASHDGSAPPYPLTLRPAGAALHTDVVLTGNHVGWTMQYPPMPDLAAWEIDTAPLARELLADLHSGSSTPLVAARFHQTLAHAAVEIAQRIHISTVVLGGGCFQNQRLLELTHQSLTAAGFKVLSPEAFPANDGGLAIGQAYAACWLHPTT